MNTKIYLDNAATTPLDEQVIDVMLQVMKNDFGNPSSTHSFGRKTKGLIEAARMQIAGYIKAKPSEIIFTSGGTEADNIAILSAIYDLGIKHIISSPIEHHAVLHTIESVCKKENISCTMVNLLPNGHIDFIDLENKIRSNPSSLVSLMYANNEIGNLLDIEKVGTLCLQYNCIFHSDTVQTIGHLPIDVQKFNVHYITCGAHKFHGPKGVGFLYKNEKLKINALMHGGSQERNLRGGTENLYGIVGLAKAIEISCDAMEEHAQHITEIKTYMHDLLVKKVEGIQFNGDTLGRSLYTILNASFPPNDRNDMLLFNLDINGIAASGGSACASGSQKGSHVLETLEVDSNRTNVRFSFSKFTTKREIELTVDKLVEILEGKS